MSIKIMKMVFDDDKLSSSQKLIMLSLADNSNDEGYCYPSIGNISKKTSLSKRTILRQIKTLEEKGFLISSRRTRDNNSSASNIYVLFPDIFMDILDEDLKKKFDTKLHSRGDTVSLGGCHSVTGGGGTVSPLYEPSVEPSVETPPISPKGFDKPKEASSASMTKLLAILDDELYKSFKKNKLLAFRKKTNISVVKKDLKKSELTLDAKQIQDLVDKYTDYVAKYKSFAKRLNFYVLAYLTDTLDDLEYEEAKEPKEETPKGKYAQNYDYIDGIKVVKHDWTKNK